MRSAAPRMLRDAAPQGRDQYFRQIRTLEELSETDRQGRGLQYKDHQLRTES